MKVTTVAVLLLAWTAPARATPTFDGLWQVTVMTRTGSCDRAARFPVSIRSGRMAYVGPQAYRVDGRASRDGRLRGTVSTGSARAVVTGRLAAAEGAGTWRSDGMAVCSGTWNALRSD